LKIAVIGAGINGLVATNYLVRAGHQVTLLERSDRVGGACVSETAEVHGVKQDYALGASVLGLMQEFVWRETGLADRLQGWAPRHPKLVHFPDTNQPGSIVMRHSWTGSLRISGGNKVTWPHSAPMKIGWCDFFERVTAPVSRPACKMRLRRWGQT
jgi:phytoene dehydrogenase-like protein